MTAIKIGPARRCPKYKLERLGHLGEKLLVVINHILTSDYREVHFNAELSTPWREVLKDLSITLSFEEDGHSASAGACTRNNISKPSKLSSFAISPESHSSQKLL